MQIKSKLYEFGVEDLAMKLLKEEFSYRQVGKIVSVLKEFELDIDPKDSTSENKE